MKKENMKKAFTLLELIFVIIIVSVIMATIIPSSKDTKLKEAATQLVSHIRYTQHLAMQEDKFTTDGSKWFEERWQIRFTLGSEGSDDEIAYAIFSDFNGAHSTHPEFNELAKDPLSGYVITGGVTNGVYYTDEGVFSKANLGVSYGIKGLSFTSPCQYYGSMRIAFDHLGRPIKGNIGSTTVEENLDTLKLITSACQITLCSVLDCSTATDEEKVTIKIEAETGFSYIL